MRTLSPGRRPRRLRTLAVGSVVLAGLAAGGSTLMTGTADAATMAADTTCGTVAYYIPLDDYAVMTAPVNGLRYWVEAAAAATGSGATGYVVSAYEYPGESWQPSIDSALSTSSETVISDFGLNVGYDGQTGQYLPVLEYSSCIWGVQFIAASATSQYISSSGTVSGANEAGVIAAETQGEEIIDSAESDPASDPDTDDPFAISDSYDDDSG